MTKTKRQLRAEAVERLKNLNDHGVGVMFRAILGYSNWNHDWRDVEHDAIELLTDEEPPEGDAVAILREAARYDGDYTSSSEALRRLTDTTTVYYALEALAEMIERDYVRLEHHRNIVDDNAKRFAKVLDERDKWHDIADKEAIRRDQLIAERNEWKTKAEQTLHDTPYVGLVRGKRWERKESSDYYCGRCGWKVTDHDSYCPECGGALHEGSSKVRVSSSNDGVKRSMTDLDWPSSRVDDCGQVSDMSRKDADCVRNDGLASENGVSHAGTDANDTREKLEADIREYTLRVGDVVLMSDRADDQTVFCWLDRQAAITEREVNARWSTKEKNEIAHLKAENAELKRAKDIGWEAECRLQAERDELRGKIRDIARIAAWPIPVDVEGNVIP